MKCFLTFCQRIASSQVTPAAMCFLFFVCVGAMTAQELGEKKQFQKEKSPKENVLQTEQATKNLSLKSFRFESVNKLRPNMRREWNLIMKYIVDSIPNPNGIPRKKDGTPSVKRNHWPNYLKIPEVTRNRKFAFRAYFDNPKAKKANSLWLEMQNNPKFKFNPDYPKNVRSIQHSLPQVNIEGVRAMYSDDLSIFFDNITREKRILRGLSDREIFRLFKKEQLPTKGWVIEIQGYTHHFDRSEFVLNTLVENLAVPQNVGTISRSPSEWPNDPYFEMLFHPLKDVDSSKGNKLKTEDFKKRLSYVFLYKSQEFENPKPGQLSTIGKSYLSKLVNPMAKVSQDIPKGNKKGQPDFRWKPTGEFAFGIPGGKESADGKPPREATADESLPPRYRTEFFVYFLWQEKSEQK